MEINKDLMDNPLYAEMYQELQVLELYKQYAMIRHKGRMLPSSPLPEKLAK